MTIQLNHTIVWASDKAASAQFLADILGVAVEPPNGPFLPIQLANGVTLDYADSAEIRSQHLAFLVSDEEFDAAFGRIKATGNTYWAYPGHEAAGEINYRFGGRGVYFDDPDGHSMELLTRV